MKNHQWTLMGTNSRQGQNAKRFVIPSEVEESRGIAFCYRNGILRLRFTSLRKTNNE
jgi:HSP20 family molecular chaperone IbpA